MQLIGNSPMRPASPDPLNNLDTLDTLPLGQRGVVAGLRGMGPVQQRLLDMGVSAGAEVEVLRYAPLGDPIEIYVRGFHLTLRRAEAALVALEDAE